MLWGQSITEVIEFPGMEPGEIIRRERERREWSQADLGNRVGISQPAIKKIEDGETLHSKFLPKIAQVLGLDLAAIDLSLSAQPEPATGFVPEVKIIAPGRDFPVYSAAEGGPGEILRSTDPVDWQPRPAPVAQVRGAYGLYVVGSSMTPEYRPGDIAIINPNLPQVGDEVYVFYAELDGEARASIKHLRRATTDNWLVSQHNPAKDFSMSRKEWQWAHRVVGKYSRS